MAARRAAKAVKELASYVHVPLGDERFAVFPAGTKVGDKVKVGDEEVEFTNELAEKVTNPKAWASEASDDADESTPDED